MTDRPIIFSAPMIRALLDGRKTQTRRVLKPWPGAQSKWLTVKTLNRAPTCYTCNVDGHLGVQMQHPMAGNGDVDPMSPLTWVRLPVAPGDRLWVREAFAKVGDEADDARACPDMRVPAYYRADMVDPERQKWRSPIHMPRWASRLTLTVTDVRVQRVQEISRGDAMDEGCPFPNMAAGPNPRDWFSGLWDSIHGPDAWDANPWVCAISFDVHRCNIDQMETSP